MKLLARMGIGLAVVASLALVGGCGGDDNTVPPDTQVSVGGFSEGFAAATGLTLKPEELPGGASLLVPGGSDGSDASGKEVEFLREYGNARIYVVEDGDPDLVYEASVGENGTSRPTRTGDDLVSIETEVATEADDDGVVWTRNCVRYEKQPELNTCAWTGTKRYGQNLIVSWTQNEEGLTAGGRSLDEAVTSAAVEG
jgi:hypothetical protein